MPDLDETFLPLSSTDGAKEKQYLPHSAATAAIDPYLYNKHSSTISPRDGRPELVYLAMDSFYSLDRVLLQVVEEGLLGQGHQFN